MAFNSFSKQRYSRNVRVAKRSVIARISRSVIDVTSSAIGFGIGSFENSVSRPDLSVDLNQFTKGVRLTSLADHYS